MAQNVSNLRIEFIVQSIFFFTQSLFSGRVFRKNNILPDNILKFFNCGFFKIFSLSLVASFPFLSANMQCYFCGFASVKVFYQRSTLFCLRFGNANCKFRFNADLRMAIVRFTRRILIQGPYELYVNYGK